MATATRTAKTVKDTQIEAAETVETMALNGANVVRDQVQRGMDAFRELSALTRDNVEALTASAASTAKGIEALNARAIAFSKSSVETGMEAARALSSAKSVHEALELQADFARKAFEAYVQEMNAFTGLFSNVTKDAVRPLNERSSAFVSFLQAQR